MDSASCALVRKAIESGSLPDKSVVRIGELLNSFKYAYPAPKDSKPIAVSAEIADALWNPTHQILRIGIQAKELNWSKRKPFNLVFLIDTSGSMAGDNRLGLVKKSFKMIVENLGDKDSIGIVTHAGVSKVALMPTTDKLKVLDSIDSLEARGSTDGASGIIDAYKLAKEHFIKGGFNRVILATDGNFNVGVTSESELVDLIKNQAQNSVYLSVFGYGMGNYKDSILQKLADLGNGNYAYIDTLLEAKNILLGKWVLLYSLWQKMSRFRWSLIPKKCIFIGYEKRLLNDENFNDDTNGFGA